MHQPDYLPWLGFFNKIAVAEKFIFFDTADYSGGGFHNRNKIKTSSGWAYLAIPLPHSEFSKPLKDAHLPENQLWAQKHWRSLVSSYRRSPYWDKHAPFFEDFYARVGQFTNLSDLNIHLIEYFCRAFGLGAELSRASRYPFSAELKSTEAILAVIKQVGATEFLAGPSGKNYLIAPRFAEEGIKLHFQDYHEPEHAQLFPPFLAGLSAIDLLFNEGSASIKYLRP